MNCKLCRMNIKIGDRLAFDNPDCMACGFIIEGDIVGDYAGISYEFGYPIHDFALVTGPSSCPKCGTRFKRCSSPCLDGGGMITMTEVEVPDESRSIPEA